MNDVEFYLEDLRSKFNKINPNDYYLSYSGGRDSELLRVIIKDYLKLPIPIVSVNTRLEFPEIHKRMQKNADVILIPEMTIYDVKEKYGIPCFNKAADETIRRYQNGNRSACTLNLVHDYSKSNFSLMPYQSELLLSGKLHKVSPFCCKYTKKEPLINYGKKIKMNSIMGITGMANEGVRRHAKYNSCFTKDGKFTPLWDLKEDLAHEIESYLNVKIPQIYKTSDRTGCVGCPYGKYPMQELLHPSISENRYNYIYNVFKESYEVKKRIAERLF